EPARGLKRSAVLVVRGEAGIGKTALLDYLVDRSSGCRVVRAVGVQSDMELAFAGLQQLCGPLLDGLDRLPAPQRDALHVAAGLPELLVKGLDDAHARSLVTSVITGRVDEQVVNRIVAETRGNPLALLELPRGLCLGELAGGFGVSPAVPLTARIEESFLTRLRLLPAETQQILLVAAAEPVGDPVLLWRAADQNGLGVHAAAPAEAVGLLEL